MASPAEFSSRFYRLFNSALGIPKDAVIEEIEVDLLEETEEEEDGKKNKENSHSEADLDEPDLDMEMPPEPHDDL